MVYGLPEASSCFRSHGTGHSKGLNEIQGSYAVSYIAKNTATKVPSMIEVEAYGKTKVAPSSASLELGYRRRQESRPHKLFSSGHDWLSGDLRT